MGVNHSNNKERCSAANLDDLLWKVLQIKVGGHKLFGRSLKILVNVAKFECAMYFDKEARCVTDTTRLIHLACKAGIFYCCAIELDFWLTERWASQKMIQHNKTPAVRL